MKPRDRAAADRLQELLVLPPDPAPDVCPGCSSWRNPGESFCPNCRTIRDKLVTVCRIVMPISLYVRPSAFRDIISGYKDRPEYIENEMDILPSDTSQESCAQQVGLILHRFLIETLPQLEAQSLSWDYLTAVPSRWRPGIHPLLTILESVKVGPVEQLLCSVPGESLSHDNPNERAFKMTAPVDGKSVLLIDDVFTTGASLHSATAALKSAGADVVAGIVIARRLRPEYNQFSHSVWNRQREREFSWATAAKGSAAIAQRSHGH
jgi:hypothetical protein